MQTAVQLMGGVGQAGYELENSDYVLSVGADLLESWGTVLRNRKIFFASRSSDDELKREQAAQAAQTLAQNKYVYCGPVQNATALACEQWLPINPGTESLFLIGLAQLVLQNTSASARARLERYADFGAFVELANKFPPSDICPQLGISEAQLVQLAQELGRAKRPLVLAGSCLGQDAPVQLNMLALGLNMLLGNINQPGGFVFLPKFPGLADARPSCDFGAYLVDLQLGIKKLPALLFVSDCNPIYALPEYFYAEGAHLNPSPAQNIARCRDIFNQIPFKVAFASFMNETVAACDLVLPIAAGLERWEHVYTPYGCGQVIYSICPPIFPPPGEAKPLTLVLEQLAKLENSIITQNASRNFSGREKKYFEQVCRKFGFSLELGDESVYFTSNWRENPSSLNFNASLLTELLCDKKNVHAKKTNFPELTLLPLCRLDLSNTNFGLSAYQGFTSGPKPFGEKLREFATALINPATARVLSLGSGQLVRIFRANLFGEDVAIVAELCLSNRLPEGTIGLWAGCGHKGQGNHFSADIGQNIMALYTLGREKSGDAAIFQAHPVKIEKHSI